MWYKTLSFKLISFTGCIVIIAISIFAYLNIKSQKKQFIQEVLRGTTQLSETIRRSTKYDMLHNQSDRIYKIIEPIGEQEGIEKVRIFNKEGEIILSTDNTEVGNTVDKQAEACFACHSVKRPNEVLTTTKRSRIFETKTGSRVLAMITPIYNEPECYSAPCHVHPANQRVLGVLDISVPLTEMDKQISLNTKKMVIFTLLTILGLSVTIGVFLQKFVSKPVKKMANGTRKIASGDWNHTMDVLRKDELGELSQSFNEMTQKLRETHDQLLQSQRLALLGRITAGVAHEINNPMTTILLRSSYMLEDMPKNNPYNEDIEVIVKETNRCRGIINSLLDFARKSRPRKKECHVEQILENASSIIEHQASINNITISKTIEPNLPTIIADPNQIQQVFINILINAIEAMTYGGLITIDVNRDVANKYINIRFADAGPGIPKENLAHIFEPFFSTKEEKGTGLGLAIAWEIIQKHNGSINVTSEEGKGAEFIIRLPIGKL